MKKQLNVKLTVFQSIITVDNKLMEFALYLTDLTFNNKLI